MPASRRRRKGFTFEATNRYGRREGVRSRVYGGVAEARKLLVDKGYTDLVYIPADVLREASKPVDGGWSLVAAEFRKLLDREGITWPVEFVYNGRAVTVEGANGNHLAKDTISGYLHRIMVKSYLTVEQAEKTIRHEVRHAKQDEELLVRVGEDHFKRARRAAIRDGNTYSRKPREVDARSAERRNTDLTLTRKAAPQTGQRRFAGSV